MTRATKVVLPAVLALLAMPALADTPAEKLTLDGRTFEYSVAGYHICVAFTGEDSLRWVYLDAPGGEAGKTATETFDRRDVRSDAVFLAWTEESGANITDLFDFRAMALHASFVTPDGKRFLSDADLTERTSCDADGTQLASRSDEEIARKVYAAFNTKNLDLLDDIMAPDLQNRSPTPGKAASLAEMKAGVGHFLEAIPDFHVAIQDVIVGDGKVVVRTIATGTPAGSLFGFETSGASFEIGAVDTLAIRDGRITNIWHLEDWFGALMQTAAIQPQS